MKFEHLIPFEVNVNDADDNKRRDLFVTLYHFGSKVTDQETFEPRKPFQIYQCLHTIAIEDEPDGFSSKALATVLKMLKFENFLPSDECQYPPVSDLLDVIEVSLF